MDLNVHVHASTADLQDKITRNDKVDSKTSDQKM
jgi:hypothetical protein